MQPPAQVAEYLDRLTRELRFDPQLSRRVRREIEDHLLEAIANDEGPNQSEAARRAIARFGDPQLIVRQYAPLSLLQQTRRVGGILVLSIAVILVLMKGRVALYDFLQWRLNPSGLAGSARSHPQSIAICSRCHLCLASSAGCTSRAAALRQQSTANISISWSVAFFHLPRPPAC